MVTHKRLQPLQCYHIFSDSRDVYLSKNCYEHYSPRMVPVAEISGSGSWPKTLVLIKTICTLLIHKCLLDGQVFSGLTICRGVICRIIGPFKCYVTQMGVGGVSDFPEKSVTKV